MPELSFVDHWICLVMSYIIKGEFQKSNIFSIKNYEFFLLKIIFNKAMMPIEISLTVYWNGISV